MTSSTHPFNQNSSLRYWYLALLSALLLATTFFLMVSWQRVNFPFELDYGEGPLFDRALSIRNGESLSDIYSVPKTYPYHIVNYPPLFFILVAPFMDPQNPIYMPGRFISLVSILVVAVNVFFMVKKLTDNRYAAVISAFLLLANPMIAFWSPYFRVDFLGLAFYTTGLAILLYRHNTTSGLILSVILIVAGAYTRQTYIVCAPLAGFVYLLPHSPRRAILFAGLIAVLGLGVLLVINIMTEWGFWFHVGQVYLSGGTPVAWNVLLYDKWGQSLVGAGPLFSALMLIFFWRYSKHWFITAYTLGSFVSLSAMVKAGSNFNYVIELIVAFSLITGVFVDQALRGSFKRWQRDLLFGLLVVQVLVGAVTTRTTYWLSPEEQAAYTRDWKYLTQEMIEADGKVLTDIEMGLLPKLGYPILFEPFDFSQMARKGQWDQSVILRDVERQAFGLIVIHKAADYIIEERWTDEMREAFDTHYVRNESLTWYRIYRPRGASSAQ